jgi:DNA processing protein
VSTRSLRPSGDEYPPLLREAPGAPSLLYAAGKKLEPAPFLAVVGSRRPTRYGLDVTRRLARELSAAGLVIVSGMARGIDSAAHFGALDEGGTTVAVLGSGLDVCYPLRNRELYSRILEAGTLLSEYERGTRALPHHFPARNRIIAGMSVGVVITEGVVGGGAMITARLAMEAGREVFAVAGPIHSPQSEGPHALVRDGARLVTTADDILEDLGYELAPDHRNSEAAQQALLPDEVVVLKCLDAEPKVLDAIAAAAGMPPATTASVLSRLELKGVAARHEGRFGLVVGG